MGRTPSRWAPARVAIEAIAAIAAASLMVAALEGIAPVTGLGVIYLLAVLLIAIRHGEIAALTTAVASVVTLNFLFIEPRHRLTIADSENVAALAVFLIAGLVVGRLAASARQRAEESETRARIADAREHEAKLLAEVASLLLAEGAQLSAVEAAGVRIELAPVPSPAPGELAIPLRLRDSSGWLYVESGGTWEKESLERIAEPLARLLDVAVERRRMSEQAAETEAARRADVMKTAVLHAVSHDLRSPLTAITTAASALRAGGLSDTDRRELLAVVESETGRLARVVDDLLDLSRIEAGAVDPQPDWCDLRDAVVSAAEQARAVHGEHPIEIDLPLDLPLVRADPAQIERVFSNLVENAVKFSPAGSPVVVTGGTGGGGVTVRVRDRGRGISASQRRRVFEPFFRGRDGGAGAGLGLAICRGFVEANGGRIQLQARRGEGTSFAVTFPLVEQPSAAT